MKIRTHPRRLEMEAIRVLEQAIKKEFGCDIQIGAELEFMVFGKSGGTNPLKLPDDRKGSFALPSYLERYRPYLLSFYRENEPNQYELVFRHNADYQSLLGLPRAIDEAKKRVAAYGKTHGLRVSFDPIHYEYNNKQMCGLHLNISAWKGGKSLTEKPFPGDKPSRSIVNIKYGQQHVAESCELLHAPSPRSYDRFKQRGGYYCSFLERGLYIENSLPGADADPYGAILVALAGVYYGLCHTRDGKNLEKLDSCEHPRARTLEESTERYRNETLLTEMLDTLTPDQLGTRLKAAVLAHANQPDHPLLTTPSI